MGAAAEESRALELLGTLLRLGARSALLAFRTPPPSFGRRPPTPPPPRPRPQARFIVPGWPAAGGRTVNGYCWFAGSFTQALLDRGFHADVERTNERERVPAEGAPRVHAQARLPHRAACRPCAALHSTPRLFDFSTFFVFAGL